MGDDKHKRVAIIGGYDLGHGSAAVITRLMLPALAAAGAGALIVGPPEHYTHVPRFLQRQQRQRKRGQYQARVHTAEADTRDDKYLHAAARRRRHAALQPQGDPDVG